MNVLLVSPYFPPQNAVASMRVHSFAQAFVRAGATLTVLTVAKRADQRGLELDSDGFDVVELGCPVPRIFEHLRQRYRPEETPDASGVPGTGPREPGRPGGVTRLRDRWGIFCSVRMPDLTDHWVGGAREWCASHGPWDVIVSSSGPYTAHLVALWVRNRGLTPRWVADFRDLWTDNHVYRGLFPFTLRERMLERRCLRAVDLLTTVSAGLRRRLEQKSTAPVEVIYNGYDEAAASALPAERIFPDDDLVRLVYTGTLYPAGQDPAPLFDAMRRVRTARPDVFERLRLVIAGQGSSVWREAAGDSVSPRTLDIRGVVSRSDALRMQRDGDGLLLVDWRHAPEGVLTTKLFEYLRAQPPILVVNGSRETPIADALQRAGRGAHLGRDVEAIARSLVALADEPESLRMDPDRDFVSTLSRRTQADRFVKLVLSAPPARTTAADRVP